MDYIYGIISQKAEKIQYTGAVTPSATTTVSGTTIQVDVKAPLPTPSTTDTGKSIKVQDGAYVLTTDIGLQIPAYTQADYGKCLAINNAGQLVWASPTEL